MTKQPTIPQMIARSTGHVATLRILSLGRPLLPPNASIGQLRGVQTMCGTLLRWGCIENVRGIDDAAGKARHYYRLTDRGILLLRAASA